METKTHSQSGFALILAILALMLLTFLGLTLSATTSTELQISTNYRWSQQAYYNAEAGIEAGKIVLRSIPTDWASILPGVRTGTWSPGAALTNHNCKTGGSGCTTPAPAAIRNWEGVECDRDLGTGYGAVLDETPAGALLNGAAAAGPYENVTSFSGRPITGAFTLWIRREIVTNTAGLLQDLSTSIDPNGFNTTLVLTSEGVAPIAANAASAVFSPRAVRVLQVKLSYGAPGVPCESAEGQAGTTASGSNFGACSPLGAGSITALAAGGGSQADTGAK